MSLFEFLSLDFSVYTRAGSSVVLHASSPRVERWQKLKETNPVLRYFSDLNAAYQDSENPVVASLRSATSTIASWFDENETARVLRMMKAYDPSFTMESFERELREYIVPEVVDAYLSADKEALQTWCSEAVRSTLSQSSLRTHRHRKDIQRSLGHHGAIPSPRPSVGFESA